MAARLASERSAGAEPAGVRFELQAVPGGWISLGITVDA
ncbi:hypothetical protein QF011_003459 [Curtobacterium flaccumfaciens]|nr:hypothetical protein [Curtobacterium flaccumfaciens]